MGISPLDPGSAAGRPDRDIAKGHGTRALGPSDSSDTGSDMIGAPGDRQGPGQRPAAGDAAMRAEGADIEPDHVEAMPEGFEGDDAVIDGDDEDEEGEGEAGEKPAN